MATPADVSGRPGRVVAPLDPWLVVGWALCVGTWTTYLLAFWPGILTDDSIDQWTQARDFVFKGDHPVFHTLTIWALSRLRPTPGVVIFAQIVLVASVAALTARELLRWRAPRWLVMLLLVALALSPVSGLMTISLWKDVPYSAALLALFGVSLRLVETRSAWLGTPSGMTITAATLFLLSMLRHNGQFVALGAGAVALAVWNPSWRRIAGGCLLVAAAVAVVRGPIFSAIGVPPFDRYFLLANQTHQLAAVMVEGPVLSDEERAVLAGVMPIEEWTRGYTCCSVIPTFAKGDQEFVRQNFDAYLRTYTSLASRYPGALFRRQACIAGVIWEPRERDDCPSFTFYPGIVANTVGLETRPKLAGMHDRLRRLGQRSQEPGTKVFFWRPAVYLYLHLVSVAVVALRLRRADVLVLGLAASANAVVLIALITVQDFRFHFGLYLIAMLSPALLLARGPAVTVARP